MKKRHRRIAIILIAFAVIFASLPGMLGESVAYAAPQKPAKVTKLTSTGATKNSISLKWSKVSTKGSSGYAVYRYNAKKKKWVCIKSITGRSKLTFKDTGLAAGTSYKYKVKAFSRYTQYYNTTTKKWQDKKPAYKNWKTKKKRTQYKFGAYSSVKTFKTKAAPKPAATNTASSDKDAVFTASAISGSKSVTVSGNGVDYEVQSSGDVAWSVSNASIATIDSTFKSSKNTRRTCTLIFKKAGSVTLTAKSKTNNKTKTITITVTNPSTPTTPGSTPGGQQARTAVNCTNYLGRSFTLFKDSDGNYYDAQTGGNKIEHVGIYDKTKNDRWVTGGYTFVQKSGVTVSGVYYNQDGHGTVELEVYNGDTAKVKYVFKEETKKYFNYKGNDFGKTYVLDSAGNRIAAYISEPSTPHKLLFKTSNNFGFDGIVDGKMHIDAYYDFNGNDVLSDDEFIETKEIAISAKNAAQECYNIAQAAVAAYGTNSYMADMAAISAYMYENYNYFDQIDGVNMYKCIGGANVLRIWSIRQYGVFGDVHEAEGSAGADGHEVFYPEGGNPHTVSAWFEANGHSANASNVPGASYYNSHLADLKATVEDYKNRGM